MSVAAAAGNAGIKPLKEDALGVRLVHAARAVALQARARLRLEPLDKAARLRAGKAMAVAATAVLPAAVLPVAVKAGKVAGPAATEMGAVVTAADHRNHRAA